MFSLTLNIASDFQIEQYPAKTGLQIFVIVIPKEGLPGQAKPSFDMIPIIELYSLLFNDYIL